MKERVKVRSKKLVDKKQEQMKTAEKSLQKIIKEIEPYTKKKILKVDTASGDWKIASHSFKM